MMKSLWRIPGCVRGDYSGAEKDLTQSCTRKPGSTQPKKATRSARTHALSGGALQKLTKAAACMPPLFARKAKAMTLWHAPIS